MAKYELVAVPGACAGHPDHPELLWMFEVLPSGQLRFHNIEIDFPEHASAAQVQFRKYDVDMDAFDGCPYCEATLYFFCKRCRSLSCFDWGQVSDSRQWTCWSCESTYRMKPKKTPFRVEAQVGDQQSSSTGDTSTTNHGQVPSRPKGSFQDTQMWHPKIKR